MCPSVRPFIQFLQRFLFFNPWNFLHSIVTQISRSSSIFSQKVPELPSFRWTTWYFPCVSMPIVILQTSKFSYSEKGIVWGFSIRVTKIEMLFSHKTCQRVVGRLPPTSGVKKTLKIHFSWKVACSGFSRRRSRFRVLLRHRPLWWVHVTIFYFRGKKKTSKFNFSR